MFEHVFRIESERFPGQLFISVYQKVGYEILPYQNLSNLRLKCTSTSRKGWDRYFFVETVVHKVLELTFFSQ